MADPAMRVGVKVGQTGRRTETLTEMGEMFNSCSEEGHGGQRGVKILDYS